MADLYEYLSQLYDRVCLHLNLRYTEVLFCVISISGAFIMSASSWAHAAMHPPKYLLVTLLVSLGGLLNGFDTATIGPVTQMPEFIQTFGKLEPTVQGIVVSSINLAAGITSLYSGDLSDSFGRPRAIAFGALVFTVGATIETASQNVAMLIIGRLLVGAGEGLFLSTVIVYTTEISPPKWRGALCTIFQLLTTLGLVLGFFISYGTVNIASSLSWRLPFAVHAGIAAFMFLGSCLYLPHSPRWLSHRGRRAEANKIWEDLGISSAEREKDILENAVGGTVNTMTHADEQRQQRQQRPQGIRDKFRAFARIFAQESRKATLLAIFLVSMQQLSGIDGVIYYAPQLFEQAGLVSSQANFLASGVSAICIFTFTIPSVLLADKWGRRPSTIYGGTVLLGCMLLMTLLYATNNVHGDSGAGRWVVIVSIFVFAIVYSMTWSITLRIFASEIQPMETRATATSLAQALNCFTNFFVAFITPVLLSKSSYAVYLLFSACVATTIAVCVVYMPETKGQNLESVRENFLSHKTGGLNLVRVRKSMMRAFATFLRILKSPKPQGGAANSIELNDASQAR